MFRNSNDVRCNVHRSGGRGSSNGTFYEEVLIKDVINALKNIMLVSMTNASGAAAQKSPSNDKSTMAKQGTA